MATSSSDIPITEQLLLWPMPVPENVAVLFTMVFVNLLDLVKYVSRNIIRTNRFHLFIPSDCLKDLLVDPISKFPQVRRINVFYYGSSAQIHLYFNFACGRIYFYSLYDLQRYLEILITNKTLVASDSFDRIALNAVISSITNRISSKRLIESARRFQILKKFASPCLHGFPAKNLNDINPCFICPSCGFIFQQPYQLECTHRKCVVCLNIRKSCTTCSTGVSRDKVWFDQEFHNSMQKLTISCSCCEWKGSLKAYQEHFGQNHHDVLTCFVRNLQVDGDNVHQSYPTETNQQFFLNNFFRLNSETSLNGTGVWEIPYIETSNNDADDQRQSIYSSPFYLFPNGYKICLRIYLNGDAKARGTHMSLFFVLMKGNYDADLQWPFKFKVTFILLDQVSSNDNQSNSFWPDITSACFQCPRSNMNIAYGLSKWISLALLKEKYHQYVENNTMYIRVEIDFLSEAPVFPLMSDAGELPNEEEHADSAYDNLQSLLRL